MGEFWVDMALSVVFSTLKAAIKSAKRKAQLKKAVLKLRNLIEATYADDPDFS